MPRGIYKVQTDHGVYDVEADSEAEAIAAVQADLKPGTGGAVYGDTQQPVTAGQERALQAMGGINSAVPVGAGNNPRFQAPGGPAPDTGTYIDPRGQTMQHDARPISETLMATAGRAGLRAIPGLNLVAPSLARQAFPSGANDAAESGFASGLLLGGKNELGAIPQGLQSMARGQGFSAGFDPAVAAADVQDAELRGNHPYAYYGGGAAGTVGSALIAPEIKGAGALVKGANIALDTGTAALGGALSSDQGERMQGALMGAGLALPLSRAMRGRVAPRKGVPQISDQRLLLDRGVMLTPGQLAGGPLKGFEDAFTSFPIAGDVAAGAQRESVKTFNQGAINTALGEIGAELPKGINAGFDSVDHASNVISGEYDRIVDPLTVTATPDLAAELQRLKDAANEYPDGVAAAIKSIIAQRIEKPFANGAVDGRTWKKIDADLAHKVRAYNRSSEPLNHDAADLIDEARNAIRDALAASNPGAREEINKVNHAFANLVRIQRAARRAPDGVFSPAQLRNAVLAEDSSVRGAAASKGKALMQDYANAGYNVLPNKTPDSGTPRRMMVNAAALATGGAAAGAHAINPLAVLPPALMAAPYLPGVRNIVSGIAKNAPRISDDIARLPGAKRAHAITRRGVPRLVGMAAGRN